MNIEVNAIFQIAGIGIIIAMIHTVLKQMGKEDFAHWVTVIGFVVVLFMVIRMLDGLLQEIKTIFLFNRRAMEIIQVVGIGLISTILILVLKEQKPMFAFLLATATGILIFLFLIGKIGMILSTLERVAESSGMEMIYLKTVFKIIGISYIAEFGAQIVRDAGQESIASKIELAGKVLIMVLAVPIISIIIETVMKLLPA